MNCLCSYSNEGKNDPKWLVHEPGFAGICI